MIVQGSMLVNLIPALWDKTFSMGHCCVTFDVCSVLILCKLWGVPPPFVEAPLHDHRWAQSLVGAEPSMAQCDHDQREDSNSA